MTGGQPESTVDGLRLSISVSLGDALLDRFVRIEQGSVERDRQSYQLNDTVALLAGYLYSGNPVPAKTFDPVVPDATIHLFTAGTTIKYKNIRTAIAYGYQLFDARNKHNTVADPLNPANSANGTYDTDIHMLGISVTYMF